MKHIYLVTDSFTYSIYLVTYTFSMIYLTEKLFTKRKLIFIYTFGRCRVYQILIFHQFYSGLYKC